MSSDSELITERRPGLNEPETPSDTEHRQQEESKEKEGDGWEREEERSRREDEKESKREERELESRCDQMWENGGSEVGIEFEKREKKEEDVEFGERRGTERKENMEVREEVEEDVEKRVRNINEEDVNEGGSEGVSGVERSIQVLDGHVTPGGVQRRECEAQAAGRVQVLSAQIPSCSWFDRYLNSLFSAQLSVCSRAKTKNCSQNPPLTPPAPLTATTSRSQKK